MRGGRAHPLAARLIPKGNARRPRPANPKSLDQVWSVAPVALARPRKRDKWVAVILRYPVAWPEPHSEMQSPVIETI